MFYIVWFHFATLLVQFLLGTNRKPVCDFLLVITDILSRTVSELPQLIVQILDTAFLRPPPFGGLRNNVRCSSWAHWKTRSGLPIRVDWTFSLGVTAESLRAKRDRKSALSLQRGQFDLKFQVQGVATHQSFLHGQLGQWMPYNFAADSFHTKKLCSRLSSSKVRF